MAISSIGNPLETVHSANTKKEENDTKSFQTMLDKAVDDKDKTELKNACKDFEGYFIQMMFKEMRKTVDSSQSAIPKSQAEDIFQSMLDEEISKSMASGRGMGLSDMLYRQLSKNIEQE